MRCVVGLAHFDSHHATDVDQISVNNGTNPRVQDSSNRGDRINQITLTDEHLGSSTSSGILRPMALTSGALA